MPWCRKSASSDGSRPRKALNDSMAGRLPPASRMAWRYFRPVSTYGLAKFQNRSNAQWGRLGWMITLCDTLYRSEANTKRYDGIMKEIFRLLRQATKAPQIALLVSALALFKKDSLDQTTALVVLAGLLFVWVAHYAGILVRYRREVRLRGAAVFERLQFVWHVSSMGDFEGEYQVTFRNCSRVPMFTIPMLDFFWSDLPTHAEIWGPTLMENSSRWQIASRRNPAPSTSFVGDADKSYGFAFDLDVVPALEPGEKISYVVRIKTPLSEEKAISAKGDYAGIPAPILVEYAELRYSCAPTHKFEILDPAVVVDMRGNRVNQLLDGIVKPELDSSHTQLTWRLTALHPGHRYWFKYRISPKV